MPLILGRRKASPPVSTVVPTDDPTGLRLWARGNAGITLVSGGVSAWANQVGSAWPNGAQSNAARRATMSTLNGITAPLFDGTDDSVNFAPPNQTLPTFTIQIVSQQTAVAVAQKTLLEMSDDFSVADRGPTILQTTTRRNGRQEYSATPDAGITWNATAAVVDTFTCTATIGFTPATTRFYRSGVLIETVSDATGEGNPRTLLQCRVGANRVNAQGFAGVIADVAVWQVELLAARVLAQADGARGRWLIP